VCQECQNPILDPALNRKIIDLFEREGVAAWHTTPIETLLPDNSACKHCGAVRPPGQGFRKETDILDVWFDSGTSWLAVCESDPDLKSDYAAFQKNANVGGKRAECLYLEGGDQHRGWFHSSLLTSVALRGRAPYSHVATAGWTLDEQGRAMSKSLGNGVDPVDIAERLGGEIVRLWVASIDFREDMAASENLMQRCAELYRKVRNTFRFLLGNLHGFDPAQHRVAEADLLPLDRYMLARTRDLAEKILGWYEAFEFHRVYQAINEFAIVDLSSFYLDVLKDRMYTFAPTSAARRSAQTVLWQITESLVRLVAPILSFTADEVWEYLPKVEGREASVHLALFPKPAEIFSEDPAKLLGEWNVIFEFRKRALVEIEAMRQRKEVGKSLESKVRLLFRKNSEGTHWFADSKHLQMLKEIMNVSEVEVLYLSQEEILATLPCSEDEGFKLWIESDGIGPQLALERVQALPASGHKCARCWNFMPEVSNYGIWQNVCTRCQAALREMGVDPPAEAA
jgi:isoleucyl-tRNA synthetase